MQKDPPLIFRLYYSLRLFFSKRTYSDKVFCIGFNKTGTTSVGKAFEMMGYRNATFNKHVWRNLYEKGYYLKVLNYASKFDSFDDLPWLKEDMIPLLDKVFPNSKFVYLTREEESWKKSMNNWTYKFDRTYPDIEKEFSKFTDHKNFVLNYFKNRSKDFFTLDVLDENGFEKLAAFLNKKAPQKKIPHFNKT